jgi:uncharacterized protein YjiS (DUF1127 family)
MEHTMASIPVTYEARWPRGFAASSARMLAAVARAPKAYGIWHDIRVLEARARKHADAEGQLRSLAAWFVRVASLVVRTIAKEARIRRDTRHLMLMSDEMLNDIGLTRAEIGRAVRYGRD